MHLSQMAIVHHMHCMHVLYPHMHHMHGGTYKKRGKLEKENQSIKGNQVRNQIIHQSKKLAHLGSILSLEVEVKGLNPEFGREKFQLC